MSAEQVNGMLRNVIQSAKQVGLDYNFDKAIIVNSLSAHKLIQFAKTKSLGNEAEEKSFIVLFTEGKNIADLDTLTQLGKEIGLDETEVKTTFTDEKYASLVKQDIQEAQQVGVQGVPFFVLDRKYAVSGARPSPGITGGFRKSIRGMGKTKPGNKTGGYTRTKLYSRRSLRVGRTKHIGYK